MRWIIKFKMKSSLTSPLRRYGWEKKILTSSNSGFFLWRLCLTFSFSSSESWARSITWDELGSKFYGEQVCFFFVGFWPFFCEAIGVFCDSGSESEGRFFRFLVGLLETRFIGWPIEQCESDEGWIIPGLFTGVVTLEVRQFCPSDRSLPYPPWLTEGDRVDWVGMLSSFV